MDNNFLQNFENCSKWDIQPLVPPESYENAVTSKSIVWVITYHPRNRSLHFTMVSLWPSRSHDFSPGWLSLGCFGPGCLGPGCISSRLLHPRLFIYWRIRLGLSDWFSPLGADWGWSFFRYFLTRFGSRGHGLYWLFRWWGPVLGVLCTTATFTPCRPESQNWSTPSGYKWWVMTEKYRQVLKTFILPTSLYNCRKYESHITRKPVFGVFDQVRLKPACSATETSQSLEILDLSSIGIILHVSKKRTAKILIRLCECSGWSAPLLFAYS